MNRYPGRSLPERIKRIASLFLIPTLILTGLILPGTVGVHPAQADNLIVVTSNADSGTNTLRAAISTATANTSATTITFNLSGSQTITLASTLTISNSSTNPITIDGGGSVILDGNNAVEVMNISSGSAITLQNLTIQHGKSSNAESSGIFNNGGTLTIINDTLSANSSVSGGGIENLNGGTLTITNSILSSNLAFNGGGGIYN